MMETNYATEKRKSRRKTGLKTQEFFTPEDIVEYMCNKISEDEWADAKKNVLEPSFGNGNFIVHILKKKMDAGIHWKVSLEHIYGVELMYDNVQECHNRVVEYLKKNTVDFDEVIARKIMQKNLVCSDFFDWDFENWKRIEKAKQLELF